MTSKNIFFSLGFWVELPQILGLGFSVHATTPFIISIIAKYFVPVPTLSLVQAACMNHHVGLALLKTAVLLYDDRDTVCINSEVKLLCRFFTMG